MKIIDDMLSALPDGEIIDVTIGLHWTAVTVTSNRGTCCGLASTIVSGHGHSAEPAVSLAGQLHTIPALELASFARSEQPTMACVGVATINALLQPVQGSLEDLNAEDMIAALGVEKTVALVGSFPFIPRLKPRVGRLHVLELEPADGEHPASAAADILPQADVVAITGMSLINHTLERLLELCRSQATVLILGPSTPLCPGLFKYGVDLLSGSIVTAIEPVLAAVRQGANFRQIHKVGVRLVNLRRGGSLERAP